MLNKVIFFNQMRNGDVHVSRNFVKYLMTIIPSQEYVYAHNNHHKLFCDVDNLKISRIDFAINEHTSFMCQNNTLFINTWIGQKHGKYSVKYGCTFKSNIFMYSDIINEIRRFCISNINNIDYNTDKFLLPKIDYTKYEINKIDEFVKDKSCKKVFISNGNVMSGQSDNFNFDPIIDVLSKRYNNILFFITNGSNINNKNVIHIPKLLGDIGSDLNECSYISTFCDILIGRISGPHTFALVQDNLLDKNKTFISISYRREEGLWYPEADSEMNWIDVKKTNVSLYLKDIVNIIERRISG